ncbi:Protein of unknown function [Bacillus mycoides]|nr:Protein of unknown function [Bacillus mycoides]
MSMIGAMPVFIVF